MTRVLDKTLHPVLLDKMRQGTNPFGEIAKSRFLALLDNGPRFLLGRHASAEAEFMRVNDYGVTIRSFSSLRFPSGPSFWEWIPDFTERLPAEDTLTVPDRCGFLVVADPDGQRGILHFVSHMPAMGTKASPVVYIPPIALRFDITCGDRPVDTIMRLPTAQELEEQWRERNRDQGELTALETEARIEDAVALLNRFGAIVSPLYRHDDACPIPSNPALFSSMHWEFFHDEMNDAAFNASVLLCMMLVARSPRAVRWRSHEAGRKSRRFIATETIEIPRDAGQSASRSGSQEGAI
ncbi:hypothetical protein [Asaia sp. As-1742]|uniref:hypothetical protein n=1 Tax=Asaia sp. As-1742 TaxID=2608325 RepID=UPI0014200A07|nr:hypothetical protein [Asaia sp. As-1742]NIE81418.1 hypothetical protein [Asaia sp. As-1742]